MELIHVTVIHVISRKQPSTWPCLGAQLLWGHRDPALRGQAMWDLYTIVHCTSLYTVQIRTAKCSQLNCENIQYIHLVSFSSVLPTFESATSHDIINIHKWHTVNVIKLYIIYIYIYYVQIICLMFAPSLPRLSRQCWFHGVRMQSSTGGFVRAKCSRWTGNSHRRWAVLKSPWNFTEVPIFNMGAWSCASETLFGRLLVCGAQRPAIPFLGASQRCPNQNGSI